MLDEIAPYRGVDPVANLIGELLGSDHNIPFNELVKDKYEIMVSR